MAKALYLVMKVQNVLLVQLLHYKAIYWGVTIGPERLVHSYLLEEHHVVLWDVMLLTYAWHLNVGRHLLDGRRLLEGRLNARCTYWGRLGRLKH
jgi:hypothetical protein